jgi:DNA-binding transcriptional ArsR family regulator
MTKIDYTVIGKALMHPLQQRILEVLAERKSSEEAAGEEGPLQLDVSPTELSKMLKDSVSNVAYHFKALRDRGWIVCTREEPRRGAMEHFYVLTGEVVLS